MHNLYSKFIEITTLSVVIFSVYLLSIEIKKYTEATNVATYQKISEGINELTLRLVEDVNLRKINILVNTEGVSELKNREERVIWFVYMTAQIRNTEVAFKAWRENILNDDDKNRFSFAECRAYNYINELDGRLFITQEYKNYLTNECKNN